MKELLTKENITLSLSILGCLGSLFSWIYIYVKNRKNFDVKIVGHRYGYDNKSLLLFASFTNKSRLAISITDIGVKLNNSIYQCRKVPIIAYQNTVRCKDEILAHHEYFTFSFPITLPELSGTSGYIFFDFPELVAEPIPTEVSLLISSNRGRTVEKTLSLEGILD